MAVSSSASMSSQSKAKEAVRKAEEALEKVKATAEALDIWERIRPLNQKADTSAEAEASDSDSVEMEWDVVIKALGTCVPGPASQYVSTPQ
jgi:hypothetical protein